MLLSHVDNSEPSANAWRYSSSATEAFTAYTSQQIAQNSKLSCMEKDYATVLWHIFNMVIILGKPDNI